MIIIKISVNANHCINFYTSPEYLDMKQRANNAKLELLRETGKGSEYLGWRNLPQLMSLIELDKIKKTAEKIKNYADYLVVLGIGGSYLGSASAINMLSLGKENSSPKIVFAGNNISTDYYNNLFRELEGKSVYINVISKSGTTIETAIAMRFFRKYMSEHFKEDVKERIIVTTGEDNNSLHRLALNEGYTVFNIPKNVGGRYSFLTSVGLLPIAVAGFDINDIVEGAKECKADFEIEENNECLTYASLRNIFYNNGKRTEILASNQFYMHLFFEWVRQLFAESEGKDGKGIFPTSVMYTSDLHSVGQIIQDGEKNIFETMLTVKDADCSLTVPCYDDDGFSYLDGLLLSDINKKAMDAAMIAHEDGQVPVIKIEIPAVTPFWLGYLYYFFQCSCAVSAYILGVNPFDQPAVEKYKTNMKALLGKEELKELKETLEKRI